MRGVQGVTKHDKWALLLLNQDSACPACRKPSHSLIHSFMLFNRLQASYVQKQSGTGDVKMTALQEPGSGVVPGK